MKKLLITFLICLVVSQQAFACDCSPSVSIAKAYKESDLIFIAKVIKNDRSNLGPLELQVAHVFKGTVEKNFVTIKEDFKSDCDFYLLPGSTYLLYLRRDAESGSYIYPNQCSLNKPESEANNDIKFFKSLVADLDEVKSGSLIVTKAAAIQIAIAAWTPRYGEKQLDQEKPFSATLKKEPITIKKGNSYSIETREFWHVMGFLPANMLGGVAEALIDSNTGEVLKISHGR